MSIADQVTAVDPSTVVRVLGIPTKFIPHDPKSNNIHAKFGLDVAGIIAAAS
jgi:1-deoxy-D-xylulose-5-phosphate synthase